MEIIVDVGRREEREAAPALALALVARAPEKLPLLVLPHLLAALLDDASHDRASLTLGLAGG
jgi:hypothetical protein